MKSNESVEDDFVDRFLHPFCEIHEKDMNQDFLKNYFDLLFLISLHGESKPPDFPIPIALVNHDTPLISDEEYTTSFVTCPPPFLVSMQVPPYRGCKV